ELRRKIVDPNDSARGRGPMTVIATTRDAREIRGVRRNEDTYSLQMVDVSGELHLLDKLKLAAVRIENRSLMPDDYSKRLSDDEIRSVVAYLKTLNERDIARTVSAPIPGGLSFERIRNAQAEPQNWLTYWGDYQATHYSPLKQIDTGNVA